MSRSAQEQDKAREHEELMALHKQNARQAQRGPEPKDQARLLDKVTESELETADIGLTNLNAKDFPLSNYSEEDTHEYKFAQEIIAAFTKARYPHPKSGLTGLSRAWAAGDSAERLQVLSLEEMARDEGYLLGTFSRAKRGEEMAQQEASGKMITETHAVRESNDSGGGGILGKVRR